VATFRIRGLRLNAAAAVESSHASFGRACGRVVR